MSQAPKVPVHLGKYQQNKSNTLDKYVYAINDK